jgi:nucleoside-diphosphate-sugar epimerase
MQLNGKILVTGSAGVVGSRLVDRLQSDGNDVIGFDIAATARDRYGDVRELASW